jgi:hypothetical protein
MNETNTSVTTSTPIKADTSKDVLFNCAEDLALLESYLDRAKWALSELLNNFAMDYSNKSVREQAEIFFNCYDDIKNAAGIADDYVFEISKEIKRIRGLVEDAWSNTKSE